MSSSDCFQRLSRLDYTTFQRRTYSWKRMVACSQGWKLKPKPKPENPVLKEILETKTETDTCLAKFLKT